jgi:hypothetical protein
MNSSFNVGQNARSMPQERAIHPDKLDQIIEAIAVGKYSWACVLMLRFSGYNPLHYMPYSTYNRIVKDVVKDVVKEAKPDKSTPAATNQTTIQDLAYVESVSEEAAQCTGGLSGWRSLWC